MVTVLLPTYNSEKYISHAIQSILNQTFTNYDFLIVDDGSTDKTEKVVKSFKDKRIRYVKKNHSGLADTLNYGLKIAKYDWVARMDADDISHPKRLEMQMNYLSTHPEVDWISCWYAVFDKKLRYLFKLPENSENIKNNLVLTSSVCFAGSILKKNKILEANGFSGNVFEDYEFLLRTKNKLNFYNIQKILYFQRKRKSSLSLSNFDYKRKIIYDIQSLYYKNLKKEFNLKENNQVLIIKGWREFLYGDKKAARYFWFYGKILINPKILIMFSVTFLPNIIFKKIRKIGFKFLNIYCLNIPNKEKIIFYNKILI